MVDSGGLVLFPDGSWMVAVISSLAAGGGGGQLQDHSKASCRPPIRAGLERRQSCGPTENTVSVDTASHLYVTHSHCKGRDIAKGG